MRVGSLVAVAVAVAVATVMLPRAASHQLRAIAPPALPLPPMVTYQGWNATMFCHFSITTFTGSENGTQDPAAFAPPADFTMDTWFDAAVAMGAPVVVLTAKHEAGFVMWQTNTSSRNFSVAMSPTVGQRDLVAEFVTGARARGLLPGLYFTITDAWGVAHLNSSQLAANQIAQMQELTSGARGEGGGRRGGELWLDV
jgi:alpha-L-fucosidase